MLKPADIKPQSCTFSPLVAGDCWLPLASKLSCPASGMHERHLWLVLRCHGPPSWAHCTAGVVCPPAREGVGPLCIGHIV